MDLVLLGLGALVLLALTLWIVWRPAPSVVRAQEASDMLPQGDNFEDQYTSATADLSAGGVAVTTSAPLEPATDAAPASDFPPLGTTPRTGSDFHPGGERQAGERVAMPARAPMPALPEPHQARGGRVVSLGAAALMTLAGAIGGAWLYARWHKRRNQPINRLRRRFR